MEDQRYGSNILVFYYSGIKFVSNVHIKQSILTESRIVIYFLKVLCVWLRMQLKWSFAELTQISIETNVGTYHPVLFWHDIAIE